MFDDLASATQVLREVLETEGTRIGNWRALYHVYLSVEGVIANAERALAELAPRPFPQPGGEDSVLRFVTRCNAAFTELDNSARTLIDQFSGFSTMMRFKLQVSDEKLAMRFKYHFHPKSFWYMWTLPTTSAPAGFPRMAFALPVTRSSFTPRRRGTCFLQT